MSRKCVYREKHKMIPRWERRRTQRREREGSAVRWALETSGQDTGGRPGGQSMTGMMLAIAGELERGFGR